MPMSARSRGRSTSGAWTSRPSTISRPDWICSSRFTQRISVLLPEPLGPHTTRTSPRATSSSTSLEDVELPEPLVHPLVADDRARGGCRSARSLSASSLSSRQRGATCPRCPSARARGLPGPTEMPRSFTARRERRARPEGDPPGPAPPRGRRPGRVAFHESRGQRGSPLRAEYIRPRRGSQAVRAGRPPGRVEPPGPSDATRRST